MRVARTTLPRLRAGTVVAFLVAATMVLGYTWAGAGGGIPGVNRNPYRVNIALPDAQNLFMNSDVRMAGIKVGKVSQLRLANGRDVHATLQLSGAARPLHEGATVKLGVKSVIEETFVEVVDGTGRPLPDGATLPAAAAQPTWRLDEVLNDLDAPTRNALASVVRRLGDATKDRGGDLSVTVGALGRLGREGHTALDVIAAQSQDLQELVAEAGELVSLLDEGQGRVVRVVDAAERISRATAAQATDLKTSIGLLPDVLDRVRAASPPLRSLSAALTPLAPPLQAAAPNLNAALVDLRPVVGQLRAVLPPLDLALKRAPATLAAVPPVATDLQALVPPLLTALADLNPCLAYLAPYGRDIAATVANVNDALSYVDADGKRYLRVLAIFREQSFFGDSPSSTNVGPFDRSNAYPVPGTSDDPKPFSGDPPKVAEAPPDGGQPPGGVEP